MIGVGWRECNKKILDRSSTWGLFSQLLLVPLGLDARPDVVDDDAVFRI